MNQITGILKNVFDRFNPYCASENLKRKRGRIDIWTHFMRECIINYVH